VSWYDPPSVDGSSVRALLQNLDLVVTSPSGVKYDDDDMMMMIVMMI